MSGYGQAAYGIAPFGLGDTLSGAVALVVQSPAAGAVGVGLAPQIDLLVTAAESAPTAQYLSLVVNGVTLFDGVTTAAGWGYVRTVVSETAALFSFFKNPAVGPNLPGNAVVNCSATFETLSLNWSFSTLGPFVVSEVRQIAQGHVRVRFSRIPADNTALRDPSNYVFSIRAGFGVNPQARRVEYVDGSDYVDLFMYRWLSRNAQYLLRVDAVTDTSGIEVTTS